MAIDTMGAPSYAPVRQDSQVIRTNAEYEAQRAAMERAAREKALAAKKKAQQDSGYNEYANRYRNAPSVAELMLQTGASASDAARIRRYQDWDNYAPEGGFGQQGLVDIQRQLNDPNRVAPEFQWKFSEPETPGQILPYYKDLGNGSGYMQPSWVIMSGSGEQGTTLGRGFGKDRLYEEAMGRGVGQAGLDQFAQQFGAKDWASLDWDNDVQKYNSAWSNGSWGDGDYQGYGGTYRGDPTQWGGSYAVRGPDWNFPSIVGQDGSVQSMMDMPGSPWALKSARDKWQDANTQYHTALQPIGAMNADFANAMGQRGEAQTRAQQGYQSLLGNGLFGGLLNDDYSNQYFGQITGRDAPQSVFATQGGQYPWSQPTQQLDVASLLSPGYGGPSGGNSMGSYGKTGGLGGLGGSQMGSSPWGGVFGAKNPWSPS